VGGVTGLGGRPALTWWLVDRHPGDIDVVADGETVTPGWAWGGARGRGVRVCVVDSGVERDHPFVGPLAGAVAVVDDGNGGYTVEQIDGDVCGHGTACASIIRRISPDCEMHSLRVLSPNATGSGAVLLAGLRWAVHQQFDVINLSLSTTRIQFIEDLRALADHAYFHRSVIVASAHNTPVESFPWRFSSVISVGSHQEDDPDLFLYNPTPPVEFFAPGQNIEVAWLGGTTIRSTGNSYATPHIAGHCANILSKHPRMTTFQLKNALYLSAANVTVAPPRSRTVPGGFHA
jgi:subtilisin family serine protease